VDGGLFAMDSESRGLEEDGTINDAIPQSLLARYGSPHREREIKALTGTKYTTVFFSFFQRKRGGWK
jgi:hypothetical protein